MSRCARDSIIDRHQHRREGQSDRQSLYPRGPRSSSPLPQPQKPRINLVIVDEAQTLDSDRGYLIELLLLKLRFLNPHLQVVCLSATLPNAPTMARWLDAQLFLFAHSQTSLSEHLVCEGKLLSMDGTLLRTLPSAHASLALVQLLHTVIPAGNSVLVFCPTKLHCEQVVTRLLQQIPELLEPARSEVLGAIHSYRTSHVTPLDPLLSKALLHGLAMHHAGLTDAERSIVEQLFRRRCVRLLAATSTLSAGVNLNVDVVMLDGVRRCKQFYTPTEYRQMIGRTGRMGQTKKGQVFVLVEPKDRAAFLERVKTKSDERLISQSYLRSRSCWCRVILEVVALGLEDDLIAVLRLLQRFAYYPSAEAHVKDWSTELLIRSTENEIQLQLAPSLTESSDPFMFNVACALCWLVNHHFLLILRKNDSDTVRCVTTELGEAAFRSSLSVEEVVNLAKSLTTLNDHVDISNNLQIIYHLTPLNLEVHITVSSAVEYIDHFLTDAEIHYVNREILPIPVLNAIRAGRGVDSFPQEIQNKLKRFLLCLVVRDLLTYDNLDRTKQLFGLTKGVLQSVQMACRVFYHMNLRILKCLHYDLLYEVFKSFESIVVADLTPETLFLINKGVSFVMDVDYRLN